MVQDAKKPAASGSSRKRKDLPAADQGSSSKKTRVSTNLASEKMEEVDIPIFADVREALEKGGCKFNLNLNLNKKYCHPGKSAVFKTEEAFRRALCAIGVNCRCGYAICGDRENSAV